MKLIIEGEDRIMNVLLALLSNNSIIMGMKDRDEIKVTTERIEDR